MNERIVAALHAHADGAVHIERLLGAVHARVRRRRHQRLATAAGAVVAVAALVGVTGAVPVGAPVTFAGPQTAPISRPPSVAQASDFGSDPTLFHLDLTDLPGWKHIAWASRRGHEEITVITESDDEVLIEADRNPNGLTALSYPTTWSVTVGGKQAEAISNGHVSAVRWQPVPGIWAQANTGIAVQPAIDVAEKLRLDRVYRCAVPFRLVNLASTRLVKCQTYFNADGSSGGAGPGGCVWFTIGGPGGPEYQVAVGNEEQPITANDHPSGRAVQVNQPTGDRPLEILYPYNGHTAYFWAVPYGSIDWQLFRSLVGAYTPVAGDDPNAWPRSPFS
jgi:hypothetical protein